MLGVVGDDQSLSPLIRVGDQPLAKLMAPLLEGYAGHYNRRHRRSGYVFQNR